MALGLEQDLAQALALDSAQALALDSAQELVQGSGRVLERVRGLEPGQAQAQAQEPERD
jgi:hypothetical protein